jgi:hypothetical protein
VSPLLLAAAVTIAQASGEPATPLPARIDRIVLHVLGNPCYEDPARRWRFFTPQETQRLWRPSFGAHWIVWTDGSLWPRHPVPGEPASDFPPVDHPADAAWRARLAREAAPAYGHLFHGNSHTVGIELAHSGRSTEPFPAPQVRTLAWLVTTLLEMSEGRLGPADVVGHKDVDRRPAYVRTRCERPGCAMFVDGQGRPYRRRVDPPEALFQSLAHLGLTIPRPDPDGDAELRRAEALGLSARPAVGRP